MTLQFPNNPSNGQQFTASNNLIYVWDGEKWITTGSAQAQGDYVNRTGDNMTGDLTLGTDKIVLDASAGNGTFAGDVLSKSVDVTQTGLGYTFIGRQPDGTATFYVDQDGSGSFTGDVTAPNLTATADVNAVNVVASGDIQSTSQNGGQLAGFRNVIQNGLFQVRQRGVTFTSPANVYTYDRWWMGNAVGRDIDFVREGQFMSAMRVTNNTTDNVFLRQGIEIQQGESGAFVQGTTWTLSLWSDSTAWVGRGLGVCAFRDAGKMDDSSGQRGQTATTFVATGETNGSYARYALQITIDTLPAATHEMLCIGLSLPSGGHRITGVQLELGPVATPFEHRPNELALCQRYYYQVNTVPGGKGGRPTIPGISVVTRDTTNYLTLPALDQMRTSGMRTIATVGFHGPLTNPSKGTYVANDNEWTSWYAGQGSGFSQSSELWGMGIDNSGIYGIKITQPAFVTSLQVGETVGQKVISLDAEF